MALHYRINSFILDHLDHWDFPNANSSLFKKLVYRSAILVADSLVVNKY